MKQRLAIYGQNRDERLADAKLRSLKAAQMNSYQAETITFNNQKCRCLINPSKLTEDYDQKLISIDFKYGLKSGDVFYWDRTKSYWIGMMKQWSEEAYLRMECRRCNAEVMINDTSLYHVYLRGPNETSIQWNEDHNLNINELNYSYVMYITKNEETLNYFERFKPIKIGGNTFLVAATDKVTKDDIIQVYLDEYFNNPIAEEGSAIEKENYEKEQARKAEEEKQRIADAAKESEDLILNKPVSIIGPELVYCYDTNITYKVNKDAIFNEEFTYRWEIDSKKVSIVSETKNQIVVDILYKKGGTFKIQLFENSLPIAEKEVIVRTI